MSEESLTQQFTDLEVDYLKRKFGFVDDEIKHIPVEEGRKALEAAMTHSREPGGDDRAMEEAKVVWDDVKDTGDVSEEDLLLGERLKRLADARAAEEAEMKKAVAEGEPDEDEEEEEDDD